MRLTDLGPLWITLIASLVPAFVLLVIRIFVMQRIQQRRQRENRQETERLKSLVAVYRPLAGSFSPGTGEHHPQMEEALAEVVLFGSLRQVELAARCLQQILSGAPRSSRAAGGAGSSGGFAGRTVVHDEFNPFLAIQRGARTAVQLERAGHMPTSAATLPFPTSPGQTSAARVRASQAAGHARARTACSGRDNGAAHHGPAPMPSATTPPVDRSPCPCGAGAAYVDCCGRWHAGPQHLQPPCAEALMRSRYCAYVLGLHDYLLATWHPGTRPARLDPAEPGLRWLGLQVRSHQMQGEDAATVEFVARSKLGGRAHRLQETSRFVRENGRWYYVDGDLG